MSKETVNRARGWRVFWPEVDHLPGAQQAIRLALWFAFVAAALAVVAALAGRVAGASIIGGLPGAAFFGVLGLAMQRESRVAALAGTAFVVIGLLVTLAQGMLPSAVTPFVLVGFVNGVRGTFAVHRLRATSGDAQPVTPASP